MVNYIDAANDFFKWLSLPHNKDGRDLFKTMLEARIMKSAIDGGDNPTIGVGQWLGGQISICNEQLKGIQTALEAADGDANPSSTNRLPLDLG